MRQKTIVYQDLRIRLKEEYYDALRKIAKEEETTVNYIINQILEDFFDDSSFLEEEA